MGKKIRNPMQKMEKKSAARKKMEKENRSQRNEKACNRAGPSAGVGRGNRRQAGGLGYSTPRV
jgi:hypothetical protein